MPVFRAFRTQPQSEQLLCQCLVAPWCCWSPAGVKTFQTQRAASERSLRQTDRCQGREMLGGGTAPDISIDVACGSAMLLSMMLLKS